MKCKGPGMRTRAMFVAASIAMPVQAAELENDIIGCDDGDAHYLLQKYRDIGSSKAVEMLLNGGLCRSIDPTSCVDEEVAFLLEGALKRSNVIYANKIVLGGLCVQLPKGEEYSIVEDGFFVTVIKIHSTGKTYHTSLTDK